MGKMCLLSRRFLSSLSSLARSLTANSCLNNQVNGKALSGGPLRGFSTAPFPSQYIMSSIVLVEHDPINGYYCFPSELLGESLGGIIRSRKFCLSFFLIVGVAKTAMLSSDSSPSTFTHTPQRISAAPLPVTSFSLLHFIQSPIVFNSDPLLDFFVFSHPYLLTGSHSFF